MPNLKFIREVGLFKWVLRTAVRQFHKRILRSHHSMVLPTGAHMNLPFDSRFASEAFITAANVDWGSESLLDSMIDGNGVFLDVGANIGYYSLYFAPRVSAVHSFEPDPRALRNLRENVARNSNIEVVPCAAGATAGSALFVLNEDAETSHLAVGAEQETNQIAIEVITLDQFVTSRNLKVSAIKIDAEGHDLEVILGALGTITQQSPILLTESTPSADLFSVMDKAGYRGFAFTRHPKTRKRSFQELSHPNPLSATPLHDDVKMLFLVPEHRANDLQAKAKTCL